MKSFVANFSFHAESGYNVEWCRSWGGRGWERRDLTSVGENVLFIMQSTSYVEIH